MRVHITGCNGFIGGHLSAHLLERNHRVSGSGRARVPRCAELASYSDIGHVDLTQTDCVIHLAARAHVLDEDAVDPMAEYRRVNLGLTLDVAQRALDAGARRFIFVSSIGVLGNSSAHGAFDEHSPYGPTEDYAVSKMEAELALCKLLAGSPTELVVVRPPLVYGARVGGNFARLIKLVRGMPLLPLGAVNAMRSYVSVYNLCDLLRICMDHPAAAGQTFIAGDNEDCSTTELLLKLARLTGSRCVLVPVPRLVMAALGTAAGKRREIDRLFDSLTVDVAFTMDTLGWTPPHSLEEGLRRTLAS